MRIVLSLFLAVLTLAAVSIGTPALAEDATAVGPLRIMHPWARASVGHGKAGAAFLTIVNTGGTDDKLVATATDAANSAKIHQTKMEDGVMKMRMLMGGLTIPANGKVELKPMGLHVMMMGLTKQLVEGEAIKLTLTFERAGSIDISIPVGGPGAMMAPKMN